MVQLKVPIGLYQQLMYIHFNSAMVQLKVYLLQIDSLHL